MQHSSPVISEKQLQILVAAIRTQPQLDMCPITYEDQTTTQLLDAQRLPIARPMYRVRIQILTPAPSVNPTNAEQFKTERNGMLVDCSMAVLSGVGVVGAAVASGPSLGASAPVAVMLWAGFLTSAASCVNSTVRTRETVVNPESDTLAHWDNDADFQTYRNLKAANTIVGIGAGLGTLPSAGKDVYKLYQLNKLSNPALKSTTAIGKTQLLTRFRQVRNQDFVAREFKAAALKAGHSLANNRFSDSQKRQILNSILRQVKGRIFAETINTTASVAGNVRDSVGLGKEVYESLSQPTLVKPNLIINIEIIEMDYTH